MKHSKISKIIKPIKIKINFSLFLKNDSFAFFKSLMNDEVFLNFDGETYSQNWFGIGIKHKFSNTINLQLGYHNISLNGGANFNRIVAGIAISTNHTKKK